MLTMLYWQTASLPTSTNCAATIMLISTPKHFIFTFTIPQICHVDIFFMIVHIINYNATLATNAQYEQIKNVDVAQLMKTQKTKQKNRKNF